MAAPKLEMWLRWGFHGRATLGPACTFAFKQSQLWAQCGRQGISDRHRQTPNHLNQIWKGSRTKQTENKEVQSRKWQEGAVSKKKRDEQGWTPFTHKRSQECCVLTRERTPTCKNQQGLQMAKRVRKWRKDANSKDRLSERAGWSHSLDSSVWKNIHWNLVDQWWPVMTSDSDDQWWPVALKICIAPAGGAQKPRGGLKEAGSQSLLKREKGERDAWNVKKYI